MKMRNERKEKSMKRRSSVSMALILALSASSRLAGQQPAGTPPPAPAPIPFSDSNPFAKASPLTRSEEHTSELQSLRHLVCRLLLEKKKKNEYTLLVTCLVDCTTLLPL